MNHWVGGKEVGFCWEHRDGKEESSAVFGAVKLKAVIPTLQSRERRTES